MLRCSSQGKWVAHHGWIFCKLDIIGHTLHPNYEGKCIRITLYIHYVFYTLSFIHINWFSRDCCAIEACCHVIVSLRGKTICKTKNSCRCFLNLNLMTDMLVSKMVGLPFYRISNGSCSDEIVFFSGKTDPFHDQNSLMR